MADLEIQRRKRPIWPWILGALALIALLWILMEMMGSDDDDLDDAAVVTTPATTTGQDAYAVDTTAQVPQDVQAFRSQCGSASTTRDEMATDHSYEADCLNRLATALNATVSRDSVRDQSLQQRLDVLRQSAQQLTQNPQSTDHAAQMRRAMQEAANVIERVAETRPEMGAELREHVSALTTAGDEFERTDLLLEQKRAAARYFDHAAEALERMNQDAGVRS